MVSNITGLRMSDFGGVLVLGGSGFIGTNLVEALLSAGHSVRIFSRNRPREFLMLQGAEWFEGDISDRDALGRAVKGCRYIYHLVSATDPARSNEDPSLDVHSNLLPTIALLELAVDHGVERLCYLSSGGTIYGIPNTIPIREDHPTDPICAYGIGKLAIEKYLTLFTRKYGLDTRILRLSNPYGTYQPVDRPQGAIAVFTARALQGMKIEIWGDGNIVRDYLHINDAVAALLKVLTFEGEERVFNLGSGQGYTLNDILLLLGRLIDQPINVRYSEGRNFDVPINVLDVERIQKLLDWSPKVTFDEGVAQTVSEFKQFLHQKVRMNSGTIHE